MLSSEEIRNVRFSKSVGGYKQEEVDVLLDKIESDYAAFERIIKDYELKVDTLNNEIEGFKASQSSIQNVLLSAQRLADQIVNEAKEKSEEIIKNAEANISIITAHEKELSQAFELKAQERKSALEKELEQTVKSAEKKAEAINAATADSIARQQMLFDRLKMEIAAFKTGITAKYKEHLELLSRLPDTVPSDPKHIAEILSATFDEAPSPESFKSTTDTEAVEISSKSQNDEGFAVEEPSEEEENTKEAFD